MKPAIRLFGILKLSLLFVLPVSMPKGCHGIIWEAMGIFGTIMEDLVSSASLKQHLVPKRAYSGNN